jgi:hypothetical protein
MLPMPIAEPVIVAVSAHGFLVCQRIVSVCQSLTRLVFGLRADEELLDMKTKEKL